MMVRTRCLLVADVEEEPCLQACHGGASPHAAVGPASSSVPFQWMSLIQSQRLPASPSLVQDQHGN